MSTSGLVMTFVLNIEACGAGEEDNEPLGVEQVSVAFGAKLFWTTEGLGTISLATGVSAAGVLLLGMDGAAGDAAAGVLGEVACPSDEGE